MSLVFLYLLSMPRDLVDFKSFSRGGFLSLKILLSSNLAAFRSEKWISGSQWSLFVTTRTLNHTLNLLECVKNKTKLFKIWFVFNLVKETNEERRKTEIGEKGGVGN